MSGYKFPLGYAKIYCDQTYWGDKQNIIHSIPLDMPCLGGLPPFTDDLMFDFFKRDVGSNELQDRDSSAVAEVIGGYYTYMPNNDYTRTQFNYVKFSFPYYRVKLEILKSDSQYMWISDNGDNSSTKRHSQLVRHNSNVIGFSLYNGASETAYIKSVNTYLINSKIDVEAWYDGEDMRLIIRDFDGNILEDITKNVGLITMYTTPTAISVGSGQWVAASVAVYANFYYFEYRDNGTEVIRWFCNNLLNSTDGLAGVNYLGAVQQLDNSNVLPNTSEALEKGYIELDSGEQLINVNYSIDGSGNIVLDSNGSIVI